MAKVAILEDEAILAQALSVELLSDGYEVISAGDGKSGVALVKKEKPDVVLLDIMMPVMDGFEVLEALKKAKSKSKIIVLSNLGEDKDKEKALKLGASDYYIKSSTDLSELKPKIEKLLKK